VYDLASFSRFCIVIRVLGLFALCRVVRVFVASLGLGRVIRVIRVIRALFYMCISLRSCSVLQALHTAGHSELSVLPSLQRGYLATA
jgi:hypothetical protein